MMGLRPEALQASFHPGEHAAGEIPDVGETCGLEDHAGLTAAVAAATIANDFFVFPFIDIVGVHHPETAEGQEDAADVELCVFGGFTDVYEVEGFTGVEPGLYFFYSDRLHLILLIFIIECRRTREYPVRVVVPVI